MSRIHILGFVFALVILFSQSAYAAKLIPVEVEIEPQTIKTDLEMPAVFSLNVKNNQNVLEKLRIAVEGPHIHWVTNPVILLVVPRNSSKDVSLTFYPVNYRGDFDFDIITSSHRTLLELDSQTIRIQIPPPIVAENFSVSREASLVTASIDVETIKKREVVLATTLLNANGEMIDTAESQHSIQGKKALEETLMLPNNPLAGEYRVTYDINGNITGEHVLVIDPIHKVERKEELVANVMFGVVTITYKNLGNTPETDYAAQETLPKTTITGFITNPESCEEGIVDKACNYVIPELLPGATAQISYRVEYWPYYIQIAAAAIIIFIIAGFSFLRAAKPSIGKTSVRKATNVHSVILELKNPFLHHLKDVVIRDWVSPLASVIREETGTLRPVIKSSSAGTELIWKLGEMRPKEVRYLSYKIKTFVGGNLKMPRAHARFRTPKGGRNKVYSKFLHL